MSISRRAEKLQMHTPYNKISSVNVTQYFLILALHLGWVFPCACSEAIDAEKFSKALALNQPCDHLIANKML